MEFHELEEWILMKREWCGLRARHLLTPCETMRVNVELYVTSMPLRLSFFMRKWSHFLVKKIVVGILVYFRISVWVGTVGWFD